MKERKIEIKWAIIFVIMTLAWMFLEKITGLHDEHIDKHATFTFFIAIPAIAVFYFALVEKRNKYYKGIMTYKQGFISGLVITLIVTILSPLTQYITSTFIATEYFPNVIKYSVSEGKMTQTEAEEYFNLKNYILMGLMGAAIMGAVTSAIVALFTKRRASRFS